MTNPDDTAPKILDLPIGLGATGMWREFDSLGDVEVPANRVLGRADPAKPGALRYRP